MSNLLEKRSSSFKFSVYDLYGVARGVFLFILLGLIVNIEAFKLWLEGFKLDPFYAVLIVWGLIELGRRFLRDYTK